jgi:hypothetical protein
MNPILSAGLLIGILCAAWTFVMGFTGWYRDPAMVKAFYLVVAIEVGGLVWGLRRTAAEGRTYGAQIVAGTLMAVVAGAVIVVSSLTFTTVAFPDYFDRIEAVHREQLAADGRSADEIERAVQDARLTATPMAHAMAGFVGTLITGILASAVIALFVRARQPAPLPV